MSMEQAHSHYPAGIPTEIVPVDYTVEELLIRAVTDFPARIAIDFLGHEYTYAEVFDEVKRAAQVLKMVGVRKGDVISVILPNCPQHYVAFYAAALLGVTVAEHNPLAPAAELDSQIDRVGSQVVIAWEQTLERLIRDDEFNGRTYLAVNLTKALPKKSQILLKMPIKAARQQRRKLRGRVPDGVHSWDNQVKHNKPITLRQATRPSLDDIAVLLMTGGTTGSPKAVALTHRNLTSNTRQVRAWIKDFTRGGETIGAVLPFFHGFGMQLSLLMSVDIAATQVMTPSFDVDILLAAHKRHPMTFFAGVPLMFKRILDAVDAGKQADLTTLRFGVSGAMSLDPELAKRWEDRTHGYLIEGYGMTETSPVISGSPLSPERRPSTLGVPFPSTEVRIVDPDNPREEVPDGEVGELTIRGPQVFAGYLNNPEETAAVMVDDWLRTGDLVRWDDGFLVMADRRKELIINSGFNVYPSEVESAVREMPGVVDVAVVGMPTDSFSESVVAALVLEPGATVDLDAVRKWTEGKLAHYAMPKSIAIFEDLPRSQLGKVMRRSVRESLANFELVSGQWIEKISEASSKGAEKISSMTSAAISGISSLTDRSQDDAADSKSSNTEPTEPSSAEPADSPSAELDASGDEGAEPGNRSGKLDDSTPEQPGVAPIDGTAEDEAAETGK